MFEGNTKLFSNIVTMNLAVTIFYSARYNLLNISYTL